MKEIKALFNKYQKNFWLRMLLVLAVLTFTFFLRAIHADRIPQFGHLEEHLYGWSGIYQIEEGSPVSWSTLDYPKSREVYSGVIYDQNNQLGQAVKLYKPWVDEPPLFSLIVVGSAHFFVANRHYLLPPAYLPFPMLFIALFSSLALFLLLRQLF